MKRLLTSIVALGAVFLLCIPAFAAGTNQKGTGTAYAIMVNGKALDIRGLPVAPYEENGTIMVPLRKIGEALGYEVEWDAETRAITVDDKYIQKATLFDGVAAVVFEGKLQIVNMSREVENAVPTVIHNGYTYVPLEFFQEFFNDTAVEGAMIKIAPSMCELNSEY